MRQRDADPEFTDLSENVFDVSGEVSMAFIQKNKERAFRRAAPLRVKKERAREKATQEVGIALIHAGPAGEVREDDVAFVKCGALVNHARALPDHCSDSSRPDEARNAIDGADHLQIEIMTPT